VSENLSHQSIITAQMLPILPGVGSNRVESSPECTVEDRAGRRRHTLRRWLWSCVVAE